MTTKVIVVNEGPDAVNVVDVFDNGNTTGTARSIKPSEHAWFHVWQYKSIKVEEVKPEVKQ